MNCFLLTNPDAFLPRVDPTAVCKENRDTPLELSMRFSGPEMRRLLGEFTEMPVDIKLFHLSTLSTDEDKEEFRDMLRSLPVELVSYSIQYKMKPNIAFYNPLAHFDNDKDTHKDKYKEKDRRKLLRRKTKT